MNVNGLAIITVNYNNYKDTEDFVSSFKNQTQHNYKIYIVDVSENKKDISFENVEIIEARNNGYAYGLNIGLRKALEDGYSNFACINNDTLVDNSFVKAVLKSIYKHKKSLIGGKIYYADGFEYYKDKYPKNEQGKVLWYAGGSIDWKNAFVHHRGVDEVDKGKYNVVAETEFVTGCLMCFDKTVLCSTGYFDESYFLYYEDADWNMKIKKNEFKILYDPSIKIWHKNSQSTEGSGSRLHVFYQEKNRLKFGMKFAPFKTKVHLLLNYFLKQ